MIQIRGILQRNKNKIKLAGARSVLILALFLLPNVAAGTTISDIDRQIRDTQAKLNQTSFQRKSLQGEVAYFDNQISLAQMQINKTNAEINQLNSEITDINNRVAAAEAELKDARNKLSEIIRVMYEDGQVSQIELVAMSNNFSDFLNRTEYIEQIQLKIKDSADKIIALKNELENKKKTLEEKKTAQLDLKKKQVEQRSVLDNQRYSKNLVLQKTKGQEGAYQGLMKELYSERVKLASQNGEVIGGGGSGGYPYAGSCGRVDPWLFYTCQCTSYAAWSWNASGKHWTNTRPGNGDAYNWPALASDQGYSVSYSPSVGAIAVWPLTGVTPYGHVAIVTGVSGSTMSVNEYNWSKPLEFGTRSGISYSGLRFIR